MVGTTWKSRKGSNRDAMRTSASPLQRVALFGLVVGLMPVISPDGMGQAASDRLDVYDAMAFAEANSPFLNALRAQVEGARGTRLTGYGIDPPTLAYAREGIPGPGSGFAEQRWVVSQSFDFPLQSVHRLRRGSLEIAAIEQELEAARRRLRADVKSVYARLLYAQEVVHLRQQEVALGRTLEEAVTTRIEVGEAAELDLMKAELQTAEALAGLESAQRDFQNQRYALFNTIGLDPAQQRYSILFADTLVFFETAIDQEVLLGRIDQQPELAGADHRYAAATWEVRARRSSLLPGITLAYWPQDFGSGYDFSAFEIGLKVPLWGFLAPRGEIQRARADVEQRRWERQAVYLDLKKQVEQAWHSYEVAQMTIRRYTLGLRDRAEELLRLTREGYQLGQLDLLTLLDAQRTWVAGEIRYYDALLEYYLDLIQLERYVGEDLVFSEPLR